jgi:enamine deaminase RidA (YjgF/YER057c/UK114 family)
MSNRFTAPLAASLAASVLVALTACMGPGGRGGQAGPAPQPAIPTPTYVNPGTVVGLDGFSQAVKVGSTMYLSPQVALDSTGRLVGEKDLKAQTIQALLNLSTVFQIGRVAPSDLVQVSIYLVNPSAEDYRAVYDLVAAYLPGPQRPAIVLLGVQSLPMPGLLVAIGGVATVRGQFLERAPARR